MIQSWVELSLSQHCTESSAYAWFNISPQHDNYPVILVWETLLFIKVMWGKNVMLCKCKSNLMPATSLNRVGTEECLPRYNALSFLANSLYRLRESGKREDSSWTFGRGMLSHSWLIYNSSCLTVLVLFISWDVPNVSNWSQVLTVGRSLQHPDLSRIKPCCYKRSSGVQPLSCWNMQALPW